MIELYFYQFMAFFFPEAHTQIDWSKPYTFLDKELQKVIREAETASGRVDKLVKLFLLTGQEVWVLIHIEIQGSREKGFPQRIYIYNYRIYDKYVRPVASFAILTDDQEGWRPTHFGYELFGTRVTLDFPIVKLLDYKPRTAELTEELNPFAVVVAAHLETHETRNDPGRRFDAKLRLAKHLYRRGHNRKQILELFRFIDWIMTLPQALEANFQLELTRFEEGNNMPYVTTIERMATEKGLQQGIQRGIQQGVEQGVQESIIHILTIRFGLVSSAIANQIKQIPAHALPEAQRQAVLADSLTTFVNYLTITNNQ